MDSGKSAADSGRPTAARLAGLAGLGIGLGVGATALGLWSRLGTEYVELGDRHDPAIVGVAERVALTGAVIGAIVAIGIAVLVVLGRRPDPSPEADFGIDIWVISMIALTGGALLWLGEPWRVMAVWAETRENYPFSTRLPLADAAYLLATVALLSAIIGSLRFRYFGKLPLRVLGVAVVVGMLLSTAVAVGAVRLGDDDANIDRSIAGRAEALPVPSRVSGEAFRVILDSTNFWRTNPQREIVATTGGFVVGTKYGIIAFDGVTGERRWHYQRVEQGDTPLPRIDISLQSADGGDVVVAIWAKIGTIAFDAATGETLWTAKSSEGIDDFDFIYYDRIAPRSAPRPLIRGNGVDLAAFDPRTGQRLWLSDTSVRYCRLHRTVVTAAALYQVRQCDEGKAGTPYWSHVTAIDPETGKIIATREFRAETEDSRRFHEVRVHASGSSLVVEFPGDRRDDDSAVLVVTDPDQLPDVPVRHVPGMRKVLAASGDGADLLATGEWPNDRSAVTSHLVRVAESTMGPVLSNSRVDLDNNAPWSHSIFLTDQLVQPSHAAGYNGPKYTKLRTWNRAGAREDPIDIPVNWPADDSNYWYTNTALIPVNGSLLFVLPADDGSITIIGLR